MTDARWTEVLDDMQWAKEHFSRSVQIYEAGGFEGDGLEAYKSRMAFLQAMQSGHTSVESGLIRIMELLGEERPVGESFHADLVRRVSREMPGRRPPIVSGELAEAIDETRRFRHVARNNYNDFKPSVATRAVAAAAVVESGLLDAILSFREVIDRPSDEHDQGDGAGGGASGGPR